MKKISKFIFIAALSLSVVSCDSFLDVDNFQEIPAEEAYATPQDVTNGMVGAYWSLGTYRFYGRSVVAVGDMGADISVANPSTSHLYTISTYTFTETDTYLKEMWYYGYKVVDGAFKTIEGGKALLEKGARESDQPALYSAISQSYSLSALSYFTLVNLYGLPYQAGGNNTQIGVPVLKKALLPFEDIKRATVEEVYIQILNDIANAKEYLNKLDDGTKASINQFFFNEAAIYALEARVHLYMGRYAKAIVAAQKAIDLRSSGDVSNEFYIKMWSSVAITDEDIFTISKTEADNLSANSLNTLYDTYRAAISSTLKSYFKSTDIRLGLISGTHPKKFDGLPSSSSTSNIPVFRKSEMYLIIAESQARLDQIAPAKTALLYTAKRNTAIQTVADLPSTKADLLKFIEEERIREFFQEGHRWYEARRTNSKITVNVAGAGLFDVAKFVYPLPADEINATGGVSEQNDGWIDNLPH
ncbi:RagB/SusD family nutrient uptake outer membrane protein [Dysgonomonas sp. ZJ279]|uniref:RagB/SusD family nutrient uptake outer membrane protein n=1 Tax=Dysgonomonas sp. ZJ279 TaxID=2709796 RepID=UPI0013EAB9C7|nr:RagB/SusD family nutrient uptake outer membrane protein [Dysgonomonas sp. ZJ279]